MGDIAAWEVVRDTATVCSDVSFGDLHVEPLQDAPFFVTLPRGRSDVDDCGDACSLRAKQASPQELPSEPLSARDIVHLRAAGWAWKDSKRCGLWVAFFFFFLAGSLEPGPLCRTGSETLDDWRHTGPAGRSWAGERLPKQRSRPRTARRKSRVLDLAGFWQAPTG